MQLLTHAILTLFLVSSGALASQNGGGGSRGAPGGLSHTPPKAPPLTATQPPATETAPVAPGTVGTGTPNPGSPGGTLPTTRPRPLDSPQAGAAHPGSSAITEVVFAANSDQLSPEAKKKIDRALRDAHRRGAIDQVKVLAWGDVAYPSDRRRIPEEETDLAKRRHQAVENYIAQAFNGIEVETHNMTERPTALAELLSSDEARVKQSLEAAGLAGEGANRGSRAIVMVLLD